MRQENLATTDNQFREEIVSRKRFRFGRNWQNFSKQATGTTVAHATEALRNYLGVSDLSGKTFLDIGSGSGVHSRAARLLNADVVSFDYDEDSVACTTQMRESVQKDSTQWKILRGSVLDSSFMGSFEAFDIVYSWGVLHHTGDQWKAIDLASQRVKAGGLFFIALYNNQGWISKYWTAVKKNYVKYPWLRPLLVAFHFPYLIGLRYLVRKIRRAPLERGMSLWHDFLDWLGGYPFETSRPEEVLAFLKSRGFNLEKMTTCGGRHGCNEFLFHRNV